MHHRHFALFFIPLLCFALVVGSAHGSPFPRCKKASSRCVGAFADDNTTLTAAALEENDDAYDDETDDGRRRNRLFPKVPLVFSCCLVFVLAALACAVCYAMHNKSRRKRQKLVPCDAYCTCPAHANV